jgi:hypothetical protein
MERGSDKVAPRLDDEMKHEVEGLIRSGHDTHVEEWKSSEPSGDDQPVVQLRPHESTLEGPASGMSAAEVEARSELASYLGRAPYPLDRAAVLSILSERHAPDAVLAMAEQLPATGTFTNLQDMWERLTGSSTG